MLQWKIFFMFAKEDMIAQDISENLKLLCIKNLKGDVPILTCVFFTQD